MTQLIGRQKEAEELLRRYNSSRSEFVAVYGRRRVGKTFLIKSVFKDKFTFIHTGLSPYDEEKPVTAKDQLEHFYHSLVEQGLQESKCPENWLEAFFLLDKLLTLKDDGGRQLVFIDELPWMDTPGSGILTAIEAFWNGRCDVIRNICFIVCGSAQSWIKKKLVNNTYGLYGRLTYFMKVEPFSLSGVSQFFESMDIQMSRVDVATAYMVFGGIPYYHNYFKKGYSLAQNIDQILFAGNAPLAKEFQRLFGSLFKNPAKYEQVVRFLKGRRSGYTRDQIGKAVEMTSGSQLSEILLVLEESDFITHYRPFDAGRKETLYRLTDPFCLFYLNFMDGKDKLSAHYWQENESGGAIKAWRGVAFEELCMLHIEQIKGAIGVQGVSSEQSTFTLRGDENSDGTQCDLLIARKDNVVNLCEMKFVQDEYVIDKEYDRVLRHRISLLQPMLKKSQVVHLTFVTTYGVKFNQYSGIVQKQVTLDDLFC